jgi:cell division initiation protein
MKIFPMDVQRQSFRRVLRGYDREEVRTYLNIVAEEMADLQRAHASLEQEVQTLRDLVEEHRQREAILKNTLLTAQRVSEDIRDNARKNAEAVVREAEIQADRLLELAQARANDFERGILDLRAHRSALRTDIRALVTRLTQILDLQEEAEVEDNLRFLKRREEGRA